MPEPRIMSRRECRCDERREAESRGEFLFWPHHAAWVFAPHAGLPRSMSANARINAFVVRSQYEHEDHDGEPYQWVLCPWCQQELPRVTLDPPQDISGLGDPDA